MSEHRIGKVAGIQAFQRSHPVDETTDDPDSVSTADPDSVPIDADPDGVPTDDPDATPARPRAYRAKGAAKAAVNPFYGPYVAAKNAGLFDSCIETWKEGGEVSDQAMLAFFALADVPSPVALVSLEEKGVISQKECEALIMARGLSAILPELRSLGPLQHAMIKYYGQAKGVQIFALDQMTLLEQVDFRDKIGLKGRMFKAYLKQTIEQKTAAYLQSAYAAEVSAMTDAELALARSKAMDLQFRKTLWEEDITTTAFLVGQRTQDELNDLMQEQTDDYNDEMLLVQDGEAAETAIELAIKEDENATTDLSTVTFIDHNGEEVYVVDFCEENNIDIPDHYDDLTEYQQDMYYWLTHPDEADPNADKYATYDGGTNTNPEYMVANSSDAQNAQTLSVYRSVVYSLTYTEMNSAVTAMDDWVSNQKTTNQSDYDQLSENMEYYQDYVTQIMDNIKTQVSALTLVVETMTT